MKSYTINFCVRRPNTSSQLFGEYVSFVGAAKQRSGYLVRTRVSPRLWQKGYYERILRDEDDTFNVARYVIQNPVRAGLVKAPEHYPFMGSSMLAKEDLIGSCVWWHR